MRNMVSTRSRDLTADEAPEFTNGMRGRLMLAKALLIGERCLERSQPSDAADMKFIRENVFGFAEVMLETTCYGCGKSPWNYHTADCRCEK